MNEFLKSFLEPFKTFYKEYGMIRVLKRGYDADVWIVRNRATSQLLVLKVYHNATKSDLRQLLSEVVVLQQATLSDVDVRGTVILSRDLNLPYSSLCSHNMICYFDSFSFEYYRFTNTKTPTYAVGILMEYFKGYTLSKVIDCESSSNYILSPSEARKLAKQILIPIKYLHSLDISHRDIKPDNIVYDSRELKLLDLGFGCYTPPLKKSWKRNFECYSQESVGSPLFSAPEVLNPIYAVKNWKAADMWSYGVVLYLLLTTRYPYEADSIKELIEKIYDPYEKFSYSDDALVELVDRCLVIDPQFRITASKAMTLLQSDEEKLR